MDNIVLKRFSLALLLTICLLSQLSPSITSSAFNMERMANSLYTTDEDDILTTDSNSPASIEADITGSNSIVDSLPEASLTMYYDDRINLSQLAEKVTLVSAGWPSSTKVGYGIPIGKRDDSVIRLEGKTLIASGIGQARLKLDGQPCVVTVSPAPISLFLLIGQSNMEGDDGVSEQSIACPDGWVYSTYGNHSDLRNYNGQLFTASALTGESSRISVLGESEFLDAYPINSLSDSGTGKMGPDSGIAYEWIQATGEKVWLVNAAHIGSSIRRFYPGAQNYTAAVTLFRSCEDVLKSEIAAGHYTLSHMGYFWCQGCADQMEYVDWYLNFFLPMHNDLCRDLRADMDIDPFTPDNELEFAAIILPMAGSGKTGYRTGERDWSGKKPYYGTYREMEMTGPRVAQRWLGSNPDYPEISLVCDLGDQWAELPDGTNGVEKYFATHYSNGIVDYPTQVPQEGSWYQPKTVADVKPTIHYSQIGYNEVGIEASRNLCILLGYLPDSEEETTIRFVDWTGYREVNVISPSISGNADTLVVPIVKPIYRSKDVKYLLSEGLNYSYYDLRTNGIINSGFLSVEGVDVSSVEIRPKSEK